MEEIQIFDVVINGAFGLVCTIVGALIGVFGQRHFDKRNRKEDRKIKQEEDKQREIDEALRIKQQEEDDINLIANSKKAQNTSTDVCRF